jgi:L-threonylcarbamoyladenylate synthase
VISSRLLRVDPLHPQESIVKEAAGVLLKGGLVAFPTETFYGLGANALDPAAVRRIFEVKGRSESKPVLVLVDSVRMADSLVKEIPAAALALMARYWPGPLTLVFRAASRLPEELTAGTGTIGIRMSGHPVAFELVRAAGVPITAPSANLSGEEPPVTAADVGRTLRDKIDLILDGGPTTGGLPSTILDVTVTPAKVIRRGALELPE